MLKPVDKLISGFLWLCSVLFLLLYIILLYYNRYAADDYFFVYNAKLRGVFGAALFTAQTWTPRPTEMLFYNFLTKYFSEQVVLISYGASVMGLLLAVVYRLLGLGSKHLDLHLPIRRRINYSILFSCSFFFASVSIGETWFWLCSSFGYLLSLVAFLWAMDLLLNKKNDWRTYFFLILCITYVGGAAETFAAFSLIVCWIFVFILCFRRKFLFIQLKQDILFKKLAVISCLSIVGLVFIYFGPGTQFRKSLLTQASVVSTSIIAAKTLAYLLVKKFPFKILTLVLFSSPFFLLGNRVGKTKLSQKVFSRITLLKFSALVFFLVFISLVPACYIMSDRGPERSFTIVSFLFTLLAAYLFTLIGYKTKTNQMKPIAVFFLGMSAVFLSYTISKLLPASKAYANAVDERIVFVQKENEKGRRELLQLEPLPPSGFYYSAELSNDTADYKNTFFKQRYDLKFNCVVDTLSAH